jgi:U3 small nucleolar RNA-associated protein 3
MMQHSVALNTVLYLLLKSSGDNDDGDDENHSSTLHNNNIDAHPVMAQLKRCNSTMQKFDEHVHKKAKGDLEDQVNNLVKAAALLQESGEDLEDEDDEESSRASQDVEMEVSDDDQELQVPTTTAAAKKQDNAVARERVLEDARFGLRQNEIGQPPRKKTGRIRQASSSTGDFGDLDETEAKSFASTINAIEQRSRTESRKRSAAPLAEQLDDHHEEHEVTEGVKMMDEEMDKLDSGGVEKDQGEGDPGLKDPDVDTELADGLDFYNAVAKKSKAKKAFKKSLYEVAPKFPTNDSEVHGERAISRTIMKNRGLVAHKNKLNRNPRVKKREQYRKALISRKGAVREVRTEEGHKYGGEQTGIKTKLSRSRKLIS